MARGYYGTNGAEVLNSAIVKGYAQGLKRVSSFQDPTPAQALMIFLIGLPILPIWSGICILITKHKINQWIDDYPAEAQQLAMYLFWYKVYFMVGMLIYGTIFLMNA